MYINLMTSRPDSVFSLPSIEDKEVTEEDEKREDHFSKERINVTAGGCGGIGESLPSRACAACKYQRRRCAPGCLLAPYFPAERYQQFLNAHKLFGLKNLSKVLKNLKSAERDEAIDSMIYEADVRASYPVHGCYGIIHQLMEQLAWFQNELNLVLQQIDFHRTRSANNNHIHNSSTLVDDALNFFNNDPSASSPSGYNFMIRHLTLGNHTSDPAYLERSSSETAAVSEVELESEAEKEKAQSPRHHRFTVFFKQLK